MQNFGEQRGKHRERGNWREPMSKVRELTVGATETDKQIPPHKPNLRITVVGRGIGCGYAIPNLTVI